MKTRTYFVTSGTIEDGEEFELDSFDKLYALKQALPGILPSSTVWLMRNSPANQASADALGLIPNHRFDMEFKGWEDSHAIRCFLLTSLNDVILIGEAEYLSRFFDHEPVKPATVYVLKYTQNGETPGTFECTERTPENEVVVEEDAVVDEENMVDLEDVIEEDDQVDVPQKAADGGDPYEVMEVYLFNNSTVEANDLVEDEDVMAEAGLNNLVVHWEEDTEGNFRTFPRAA